MGNGSYLDFVNDFHSFIHSSIFSFIHSLFPPNGDFKHIYYFKCKKIQKRDGKNSIIMSTFMSTTVNTSSQKYVISTYLRRGHKDKRAKMHR